MQRQAGQGRFDVDPANARVANVLFLFIRKQVTKRPEEVMEGDVDSDEVNGIEVVSHVNSKAGCWEISHVVHIEDPCEGDLFVSYLIRQRMPVNRTSTATNISQA